MAYTKAEALVVGTPKRQKHLLRKVAGEPQDKNKVNKENINIEVETYPKTHKRRLSISEGDTPTCKKKKVRVHRQMLHLRVNICKEGNGRRSHQDKDTVDENLHDNSYLAK